MKKFGLLILFALTVASFGGHDIDITHNVVGGEAKAGDAEFREWVNEFVLRYSGLIPFSDNTGLLLGEEFDGITMAAERFPGRAVNHPVSAHSFLGLEYTGLGTMQIKGISRIMVGSLENDFPVYFKTVTPHVDARMIQRFKNSADFYWHIPASWMDVTANVQYTSLVYDYYRMETKLSDQYDSDLWFNGSMAFRLIEDNLRILARGFGKHDLNDYGGYNIGNVAMGLGSDFTLFNKKLQGTGEVLPRYYVSSIMAERGYADELGILSNVRFFYKLKPRTFIKGDLEYELAPASGNDWYIKQRYEAAIRNGWKNGSSVEAGGWGTFGTLFPRICGYAKANFMAGSKFAILPGARAYLLWEQNWTKIGISEEPVLQGSGYSYYRTDMELMLRYTIGSQTSDFFKNFAIKTGAEYKVFDWGDVLDPPFVNTLRIFLGLTNYL